MENRTQHTAGMGMERSGRNSNHWKNNRFEKELLEGLPGHVLLSDYDSINYVLYYAYNQIYRSCRMHLPLNRWKIAQTANF